MDQASSKVTVLEAKSKLFAQATAKIAEMEKKVAKVDQGIYDLWDAFHDDGEAEDGEAKEKQASHKACTDQLRESMTRGVWPEL